MILPTLIEHQWKFVIQQKMNVMTKIHILVAVVLGYHANQ